MHTLKACIPSKGKERDHKAVAANPPQRKFDSIEFMPGDFFLNQDLQYS